MGLALRLVCETELETCAVGGHFPQLPPTPKPFGIDLLNAEQRRCPRCREIRPKTMFQYESEKRGKRQGSPSAAICSECRDNAKAQAEEES